MGDVALDRLFATRQSRASQRSDIPTVHPYARGSLQRIGVEASPSNDRVTIDLAAADAEFLADQYAKSAQAPSERADGPRGRRWPLTEEWSHCR